MKKFPKNFLKEFPEFKIFKKLDTPWKVQDFLDSIPINFEIGRETYRTPLYTLKHNKAHCMEGALLAAAILWYHGHEPLIMDFRTSHEDTTDHVVALFKWKGHWGAISKTNHNVLRYRDPIYKNIRELAMSYFNEYFIKNRNKTLREYSKPFSLLHHPPTWMVDKKHTWDLMYALDDSPHISVLPKGFEKYLRKVDKIEYDNSVPTEWKRPQRKN